jgi:hypothetical protein
VHQIKEFSSIFRLQRQTLKTFGYVQPSVAKDKPAGSGLTKPICLSFSLLPAGLIALASPDAQSCSGANMNQTKRE